MNKKEQTTTISKRCFPNSQYSKLKSCKYQTTLKSRDVLSHTQHRSAPAISNWTDIDDSIINNRTRPSVPNTKDRARLDLLNV